MAAHKTPRDYMKIYGLLLVLLVVSVLGPFLEIKIITLITAFGIAGVKAYLVCKHFMHLGEEPVWVRWMLIGAIVIMIVMFYGVAPDVMKPAGTLWEKNVEVEWHETNEAHRSGGASDHAGQH